MIPDSTVDKSDSVVQDFNLDSERDMPTKTYRMRLEKERVSGYTDNQDAMKQAIFKILNTERYQYPDVYSDNYGVELRDLFGMPMTFVIPEVQRRIVEALTWDERITSVTGFSFSINDKKKLAVKFTANTIFGTVEYDNLEVEI